MSVVILRENMRLQTQTQEDKELRQALENMHYKACTPADLAFLRTRVSSEAPGHLSVNQKEFRHISIITTSNVHKDEINRLGSLRFAKETRQNLVDFFSEDTIGSWDERAKKERGKQTIQRTDCKISVISDKVQEVLWHQPHSANSKNIPGKLSLCIGMPVMIRSNMATELCITKGQEGVVHGWQASVGSRNQRVLDTLFVRLLNPPQTVQFDNLPENVVPLTRSSVAITCSLPDDSSINITGKQVKVLSNFSMTDYGSQGKTRPYNVTELNNCCTHQSYYTVLSRSASASGTIILQGFNAKKIMGGASGALCQEFRELELLDEIS